MTDLALCYFIFQLEAGTSEKVCLVSRDEQSVLVVTYRDLKTCFESAFSEIVSASLTWNLANESSYHSLVWIEGYRIVCVTLEESLARKRCESRVYTWGMKQVFSPCHVDSFLARNSLRKERTNFTVPSGFGQTDSTWFNFFGYTFFLRWTGWANEFYIFYNIFNIVDSNSLNVFGHVLYDFECCWIFDPFVRSLTFMRGRIVKAFILTI